jgi:hypothetical protein
MWKKPNKLTIGALSYKVKYVVPGSRAAKELIEGESGCINQERHLIEIDKNISDQMTLLVLIHEILHGIGDAMSPNRSPFSKENFTCTVAELLISAFQSAGLLPTLSADLPRPNLGTRKYKK